MQQCKTISFANVKEEVDHCTHWWPAPVCLGASPVRWWGGGRSICRLPSLRMSGCLSAGPESWRTVLMWAGGLSAPSLGNGFPPCYWPAAMTALCTGTYWLHRWDGGLRPLWVPPCGSRWSLPGRLKGKHRCIGEGDVNIMWAVTDVWWMSPLCFLTWEYGSCQVPETRRADSADPPFFLTFDDNAEWLLWVKAASGIQWKGLLFTLATWNFPWKRLESFLMPDSVYLSRTPQGLPK